MVPRLLGRLEAGAQRQALWAVPPPSSLTQGLTVAAWVWPANILGGRGSCGSLGVPQFLEPCWVGAAGVELSLPGEKQVSHREELLLGPWGPLDFSLPDLRLKSKSHQKGLEGRNQVAEGSLPVPLLRASSHHLGTRAGGQELRRRS